MDERLTQKIRIWLETPRNKRDIPAGAMMLLRINQNQVLYNNILRKPHQLHDKLEYELRKQLQWRLQQVTHEIVADMEQQVERIASKRSLAKTAQKDEKEYRQGKREDHESLPDDIQALYVENKSIMQRMRDLHAQLRIIQQGRPGFVCKDSDKFPFLKELISLDKKYRENWAAYDGFDVNTAETIEKLDSRVENRRALAFINFNKKRYRENPSEELRTKLAEAYAKVTSPTEKLTKELLELGVISKP